MLLTIDNDNDCEYSQEIREKLNIQNNQLYVRLICYINKGEHPVETILTLQSQQQAQDLFEYIKSYNVLFNKYESDECVNSTIFLVNHEKNQLIDCIQSAGEFKQIIAEKIKEFKMIQHTA